MTGATPGSSSSGNRNVMIALSYLWLLALVPLLTEKDDREIQWHAKHGLVLMVIELFVMITLSVLVGPLGIFGCVAWLVTGPLFFLGYTAFHIYCIVRGINGQRVIIPGVSEFADKF